MKGYILIVSEGRKHHESDTMGVNLGELPSDALLQELQSFFSPFGEPPQKVIVPKDLRDAINQFVQPSVVALSESGLLPILNQAVHSFEQIPKLVDEVRVEDTVVLLPGPRFSRSPC